MITAASENTSSRAPSTSDLAAWASFYSLTFPVVADPGWAVDRLYDPRGTSRPSYVLLEPGAKIAYIGGTKPSNSEIEAILPR